MDKITIRRATPEDKEVVLGINDNVYEGRDYLPSFYDPFLSSPAMLPVVMLYENQIIAFEVGHIIDNGETIVNRAGRVDLKFEAKGLIKVLSQYLFDWGLSKGVKAIVFTVSDGYSALTKPSFRKLTRQIMTKQFPMYYLAGHGLSFSEEDVIATTALRSITDLQLSLYFKSKELRDYFCPEDRMIIDAVPYKIMDANIQFMRQPNDYSAIYSDIKVESGSCSGLLSFGHVYPTAQPQYQYRLDLFGNDTTSLRIHIVKHLIRLKECTKGVTAMLVYVPETFDLENVDMVFEEYGISRRPHQDSKLKSRQIYAFEGLNHKLGNL